LRWGSLGNLNFFFGKGWSVTGPNWTGEKSHYPGENDLKLTKKIIKNLITEKLKIYKFD
jgi:hypothetical protein